MIKQLKKFDIQTTPFIATKNWSLLNVQHQDLVFLEQYSSSYVGPNPTDWISSSIPETYVALEFVDYTFDAPEGSLNTDCDVALEQQEFDPVIYEEGISGSGLFYPEDPKNPSGTYKRLIYHQILRAFYNDYHNPLKAFGLEQIDFQTSGMQRYLSPIFKIFTLPQINFGDKVAPGSVTFIDNAFDDNYTVQDDTQGNLMASPNLFSRNQELRTIENILVDADSPYECPAPVVSPPVAPITIAAIAINESSSYFSWTVSAGASGYYMYRTDDSGSNWAYLGATPQTASYDYTLQRTSSYSYRVIAYNAYGISGYTNTASISTPN